MRYLKTLKLLSVATFASLSLSGCGTATYDCTNADAIDDLTHIVVGEAYTDKLKKLLGDGDDIELVNIKTVSVDESTKLYECQGTLRLDGASFDVDYTVQALEAGDQPYELRYDQSQHQRFGIAVLKANGATNLDMMEEGFRGR